MCDGCCLFLAKTHFYMNWALWLAYWEAKKLCSSIKQPSCQNKMWAFLQHTALNLYNSCVSYQHFNNCFNSASTCEVFELASLLGGGELVVYQLLRWLPRQNTVLSLNLPKKRMILSLTHGLIPILWVWRLSEPPTQSINTGWPENKTQQSTILHITHLSTA